jgi:hypothetical protein
MAAKSMSPRKLAAPLAGSLVLSGFIAAVYLVWAPPSTDLAAQTFRAELFADRGFAVWSEAWYGGFHVPSYSVLYPPLAALVGVRVAGAIAAVAAAALFAVLAERRFKDRALLGSVWFAAGVSAWLFTGRLTFLLGVAIALGALLAADARRHALAAIAAALTALASPVAGAFLALTGVSVGLAGARVEGAALATPAAAVTVALGLAFPTVGEAPFVLSSFVAIPLLVAGGLLLVPPEHRALRIGVVLYGLAALAAFAVPNPVGGNVVRLGALFAGPLAALVLWRRPLILVAVAAPLLYWQLDAPIRDTARAVDDPSTAASYYEPLLDELNRRGVSGSGIPQRIHVPPTLNRWEAVHVAEHVPLARGWLRQLESDDFDLFDGGNLTAASYAGWLREHGVSYVAVPDAELDYLSRDEVALIGGGLPFLEEVWENDDWQLYRVVPEPSLVSSEAPAATDASGDEGGVAADGYSEQGAFLRRLGPAAYSIEGEPGEYRLGLTWTPYWQLDGAAACVSNQGGWTGLELRESGRVELEARFSPAAAFGRGRVCSQ